MPRWRLAARFPWLRRQPAPDTPPDAASMRQEGHWRRSRDERSPWRWPQPEHGWPALPAFLEALDRAEAAAERLVYRGISPCRLCGRPNGCVAFRLAGWEWPEGYRHYLADHAVRPTPAFQAFAEAAAMHEAARS